MNKIPDMTEQEKAQTRAWMKNWEELGPIPGKIRRDSLKHVNTAEAIEAFDLAYKSARLHQKT